jgi:hypothetical protein
VFEDRVQQVGLGHPVLTAPVDQKPPEHTLKSHCTRAMITTNGQGGLPVPHNT